MDNKEKLNLDDISFDDFIDGGVATAGEEAVASELAVEETKKNQLMNLMKMQQSKNQEKKLKTSTQTTRKKKLKKLQMTQQQMMAWRLRSLQKMEK